MNDENDEWLADLESALPESLTDVHRTALAINEFSRHAHFSGVANALEMYGDEGRDPEPDFERAGLQFCLELIARGRQPQPPWPENSQLDSAWYQDGVEEIYAWYESVRHDNPVPRSEDQPPGFSWSLQDQENAETRTVHLPSEVGEIFADMVEEELGHSLSESVLDRTLLAETLRSLGRLPDGAAEASRRELLSWLEKKPRALQVSSSTHRGPT